MTIINPKSIAGVTSITTASGADNLLTVHTNNGTERFRIDNTGTTKIVTGIVTTLTVTTGIVTTLTTNTLTANSTTKVGSGITVSPDGDIFATGVTTSTTFVGALTGNVTGNATGLSGTPNISAGTIAGSTGTFTGDVDIADKIVHTGDTNTAIRFPSADTIQFETSGSARLKIDDNGKILVATTTTSEANANNDELIIGSSSDDANHGLTIVTPNDHYGTVAFSDGSGGTGQGLLEYNHSGDYMRIYTAASERLRIQSDGDVVIGDTDADAKLHVHSAAHYVLTSSGVAHKHIHCSAVNGNAGEYGGAISFAMGSTGAAAVAGLQGASDADNVGLAFITHNSGTGADNAQESARLTSDGKFLIGRTSNSGYDSLIQSKSITVETDGDTTGMQFNRTDSNAAWVAMRFRIQDSQKGYIQVNTGSVTYSTSSDYRLKENVVSISDGITRLKQLKPYRFNFKSDSSTTLDGFYAHEASEVVPESVVGTKDAVDSEGNIDPQGIDQSKLVPLLTAALQEAVTKIEVLETRLNNAGIAT